MDPQESGVFVSMASKDDLAALIDVQLAVFGQDTPESRAAVIRNHDETTRANSGLVIIKASLPGGKVIGFCKLFLPNIDALTERERVPTPMRPACHTDDSSPSLIDEYFWIKGPKREEQAKALKLFSAQEIQQHVSGRECAYVGHMCVEPSHQRQGVGKALMLWVCERLDERKTNAYLESSRSGEGLYKKFGFEVIGQSKRNFGDGLVADYSHMWRKYAC